MGQTDGTVAQTVIAQIVLPTCSSDDHDTFPEYLCRSLDRVRWGVRPAETTIVVP